MRISTHELHALPTKEVIRRAIVDPYPAQYRQEVIRRSGLGDEEATEIVNNGTVRAPYQHHLPYRQSPRYFQPRAGIDRVRQCIIDVLEGRRIYAHACRAILEYGGWDYIDESGLMHKSPDEVRDFLSACSYEAGMYNDMFPSRKNLLKMIFDAFLRSQIIQTA